MPCKTIDLGRGPMIFCTSRASRGGRTPKCHAPSCHKAATLECDFVLDSGTTCNEQCCRAHAKPIATNVDYCVRHALAAAKGGRRALR